MQDENRFVLLGALPPQWHVLLDAAHFVLLGAGHFCISLLYKVF